MHSDVLVMENKPVSKTASEPVSRPVRGLIAARRIIGPVFA